MSKLLLVRHGDTTLNSTERYWGATDVPLSAVGLRQAEKLRDRLSAEKLDIVYSSSLQRASVTAETIASSHKLKVITCPELREIDFGQLEGLTFSELNRLYPEVARLWAERNPNLRYPGGESLDELSNRVSGFAERAKNHTGEETVLIVAHSGVLRTLICQILAMELRYRWQIRLDLASLSAIEVNSERAALTLLNDVHHLAELS